MFSLNTGDTGFVMLCTALVCMMTPALALFYGGMVRKKNVLTIMMQNFISMGVTAIIWIFGGFSLAFGPDVGGLFGDISYHFALDKVGIGSEPRLCEHCAFHPVLCLPAYVCRHRPGR